MLVHIFCKVDSICCANWVLRKTSPKNLPNVKQAIEGKFYMDNFLILLSNVDELMELSKRVISGFHLTKWVTNSFAISSSLPKTEISPKLVSPAVERALGMI